MGAMEGWSGNGAPKNVANPGPLRVVPILLQRFGVTFIHTANSARSRGRSYSSKDIPIPDSIVPEQWSWGGSSLARSAPEAQLMVSVLDDAIFRFLALRGALGKRAAQERKELEDWFESEDVSWLFSFESICATLDVNAAGIREAVSRWKAGAPPQPGTRRRKRRIRNQTGLARALGQSPRAQEVA